MGFGELLGLIGIALAVWALQSEEKMLRLRATIHKKHWIYGGIGLAVIHLILAFDWLHSNYGWMNCFYIEKGIPTGAFAYALILFLFGWVIYLLEFKYFNRDSTKPLLAYYNELLDTGKERKLMSLFKKHHFPHYEYETKTEDAAHEFDSEYTFLHLESENDKSHISNIVLANISSRQQFWDYAVMQEPQEAAKLIISLTPDNIINRNVVNQYVNALINIPYQDSKQYLEQVIVQHGKIETKITEFSKAEQAYAGILRGSSFANRYSIWQPFAMKARKELRRSDELKRTLEEVYHVDDKHLLDNTSLSVAIDLIATLYMMRLQDNGRGHMWISYYDLFISQIIENIDQRSFSDDYKSFAVEMIETILYLFKDLINESARKDDINGIQNLTTAFIACLSVFAKKMNNRPKLGNQISEWFDYLLDTYWTYYFKAGEKEAKINSPFSIQLRLSWKKAIHRYFGEHGSTPIGKHPAAQHFFSEAWKKFDFIKHEITREDSLLEQFDIEIGSLLQLVKSQ